MERQWRCPARASTSVVAAFLRARSVCTRLSVLFSTSSSHSRLAVGHRCPRVFAAPREERRAAHTVPAQQIRDGDAQLRSSENSDALALAVTGLVHDHF